MAKKPQSAAQEPDKPDAVVSETLTVKTGRPTLYSPEMANEIAFRLSAPESMRSICADDNMPDRSTVARWMATQPDFAAMITHARELQAWAFADEILAIADDKAGDVTMSPDGKPIVNWESVQRAKLRCDARRWYASKLAPKKFGERVTQEVTGAEGGPVMINRSLTPAEVQLEITRMLDKAEREMKMPAAPRLPNAERLQRLIECGKPIAPELYGMVYSHAIH